MNNSRAEIRFSALSKPKRIFITIVCGVAAMVFFATVIARRLNRPVPKSFVAWVGELGVDSIAMAMCYTMVSVCLCAVYGTPAAERLLVKRLKRVAFFGIALVISAVVLLLIVNHRLNG